MTKTQFIETLAVVIRAANEVQISSIDGGGEAPDHSTFKTVNDVLEYVYDRAKFNGDLDNLPVRR